MVTYKTQSGNTYTFCNGRVTCDAHNLQCEPAFNVRMVGVWNGTVLMFRTAKGTWRTSPVCEVSRG